MPVSDHEASTEPTNFCEYIQMSHWEVQCKQKKYGFWDDTLHLPTELEILQ
jgi:hypothetical protein